jgi:hypothetical protein
VFVNTHAQKSRGGKSLFSLRKVGRSDTHHYHYSGKYLVLPIQLIEPDLIVDAGRRRTLSNLHTVDFSSC